MYKDINKNRCNWVNLNNEEYVKYHDNEWCVPCYDDIKIFENLILEIFQAGLSYEIILHKRENFRKAFSNFDYNIIANYTEKDVLRLLEDTSIVRNKKKILACINNAKSYIDIISEYSSFSNYIWGFVDGVVYEASKSSSTLSDTISKDLKNHNFQFIGTVTCYSFLQAIGIVNSHEKRCFKHVDI